MTKLNFMVKYLLVTKRYFLVKFLLYLLSNFKNTKCLLFWNTLYFPGWVWAVKASLMLTQLGWNWAWQLHAIIFGKMCNVQLSFCPLLQLTCFSPINLKQPHNWVPSPQCSCQTQSLISQFGLGASGCVGWLKQKIWVENTDKTWLIMEGTSSTS